MKIIAVDTNPLELLELAEALRRAFPGASVECFIDPMLAYQFAVNNQTDAVFALAEMKRLSGCEISERLRKRFPQIRSYLIGAPAADSAADGWLTPPFNSETMRLAYNSGDPHTHV